MYSRQQLIDSDEIGTNATSSNSNASSTGYEIPKQVEKKVGDSESRQGLVQAQTVQLDILNTLSAIIGNQSESKEERKRRRLNTPILQALSGSDNTLRTMARNKTGSLIAALQQIALKKQNVEETMKLLAGEIRESRIRRRWKRVRELLFFSGIIMCIAEFGFEGVFKYWYFIVPLYMFFIAESSIGRERNTVFKLGQAWEPRAVGVVALAYRDGDKYTRQTAEKALQNLLTRVRASDAGYIDRDQMKALLTISHKGRKETKIALLKALEQIGDVKALPVVSEMIALYPGKVARAASECLPFLTARILRQKESATLLRASSSQDDPGLANQLLRPVSSNELTPPEELLRPASNNVSPNLNP